MKVEPIHHVPMRREYNSPFSAAYSIEGGRLVFFSGCCTVPTYHRHPHDPDEERRWLAGDFREQTERTFVHIKEILDAAGAQIKDVMKLTIFTTIEGVAAAPAKAGPGVRPGDRRGNKSRHS
jgi:enamine deaminase RidA (YjgF/YER057c/UK114 family)